MSGRRHRQKGDRAERRIVEMHLEIGVAAERRPLSGADRFQGVGADLDVYALGPDAPPLHAECKARASGEGFAVLERWLGQNDLLILKRDRAEPLILLPWRTWVALLRKVKP